MILQLHLQVRNRRDVLPRVVMLIHRRGLDVCAVDLVADQHEDVATMALRLRGDPWQCERIAVHLRNLVDVHSVSEEQKDK